MFTVTLNGLTLALTKDSFKKSLSEVASNKTSEGGTTLRAITRLGIPTYQITYKCDGLEKSRLEALERSPLITAQIYDESINGTRLWNCYMSGFSASLIVENDTTYYKVSFTLNDLETV